MIHDTETMDKMEHDARIDRLVDKQMAVAAQQEITRDATWSVSLDVNCPVCLEDVDLLDADEFFEQHKIDIAEHNTPRTLSMQVDCPLCGNWFLVKLCY